MNTSKLQDALTEIEAQQRILEQAALSIRNVLQIGVSSSVSDKDTASASPKTYRRNNGERTYIDDAIGILKEHGHPLKRAELARRIAALRNMKSKASIEASIYRHTSRSKNQSIVDLGSSEVGLPQWRQPTLAQIA